MSPLRVEFDNALYIILEKVEKIDIPNPHMPLSHACRVSYYSDAMPWVTVIGPDRQQVKMLDFREVNTSLEISLLLPDLSNVFGKVLVEHILTLTRE